MVWQWNWQSNSYSCQTTSPPLPPQAMQDQLSTDSDSDTDIDDKPTVQHSVRLKCIGANKEQGYQEALAQMAHWLRDGVTVEIKMFPEPTNPIAVDTKAIAFNCKVDGSWLTIGYVVCEALDVHLALAQ